MRKYRTFLVNLVFVILISACGGVSQPTPDHSPLPTPIDQHEDVPEFTEKSALALMQAYKASFLSLIKETENDQKVDSFQSKEEIKQHFQRTMSEEYAASMTDSFFIEEADGVSVIARGGPTWLEEDQPFELEKVSDQHVEILQEQANVLLGHVMMIYHVKFQGGKWVLSEVERIDLGEKFKKEAKENAQMMLKLLATQDMKTLATYVHPEKGLLFSPYVYVEENAQVFQPDEVEKFLEDTQVYPWGVHHGSGNPIEGTPQQYYKEFVYDRDFLKSDQILMDKILQRGNTRNNLKEIFPNSIVVEFHMEGSEEFAGMDWASLNLVFEQDQNGKWGLVAIVHDQWTI